VIVRKYYYLNRFCLRSHELEVALVQVALTEDASGAAQPIYLLRNVDKNLGYYYCSITTFGLVQSVVYKRNSGRSKAYSCL
jgi:hypothetical protein